MALVVGNIGARYEASDVITKNFIDASATDHYANRVVTFDAGNDDVKETSAVTDYPIGVTLNNVSTTASQLTKSVDIQTGGIAMIKLTSATVSAGDNLEATASGLAQSTAGSNYEIGYAMKSGVANEIIPVKLVISGS